MSLKFWEKHSEEMRVNRLLQAAAVMYASGREPYILDAVYIAIRMEKEVIERINAVSKETRGSQGT